MRTMTHEEAVDFFAALYGGRHRIPGRRYGGSENVRPWGTGWRVSHHGEVSTYDSDTLTRLVLLAHERCVRAAVLQGGPGGVSIGVSPRERDGGMWERHPTIETALRAWEGRR